MREYLHLRLPAGRWYAALTIDNYAGRIFVRAGEEREIRVLATKHTSRASNLERIEVQFGERSGGVSIRTGAEPGAINSWVRLEITTPVDTRLDLSTGSGSVEVRNLWGGAKINSGSGSLTLQDLGGKVDAYSGSGSIEVLGFTGDLQVRTGSGGIDVFDLEGTLKASGGTGSMEVRRASGEVQLNTGSGSIEYQGSPAGECRFGTNSDHFRLELPAGLNADLDVHTSSGTVDVGWPTVKGVVRKDEVNGTIGGGRSPEGPEASASSRTRVTTACAPPPRGSLGAVLGPRQPLQDRSAADRHLLEACAGPDQGTMIVFQVPKVKFGL